MWNNLGRKLQKLAKVLCVLGIIFSVFAAVTIWSQNSQYPRQLSFFIGLLYLVVGSLSSWLGSWTMCGLGKVVEYVENKTAAAPAPVPSEDIPDQPAAEAPPENIHNYWICRNCKTINSNSMSECRKCGSAKP